MVYDVIIVGARCAGAASALEFARSDRSVLVLDQNQRGSDTLSTHILAPGALDQLARLGLLEAVRTTGAPPVQTFLVEFDGKSFPNPVEGSQNFILSVRRTTLDPILVEAAEQAGATFRFGAHVNALIWDNGRVVGVKYQIADKQHDAEAKLIVGADGRHSTVARSVAAREYNNLTSQGPALYAYFRGVGPTAVGASALQWASGPGCDILCCPCDGDLHMILLIVEPDEFKRIGRAGAPAFEALLQTIPTLAPRLSQATLASKLFLASLEELRGYFRQSYGPGWVLVGDAGYHAHPAGANGIRDALRSAELVHEQVEQAWEEGVLAETYLDRYQQIRDAENTGPYYFSYRLGGINPFRDPELAAAMTGNRTPAEDKQW